MFHERARFLPLPPPATPSESHRGWILSRIFLALAVPRLREVSHVRQTHSVLLLGRLSAVSPCFFVVPRERQIGTRRASFVLGQLIDRVVKLTRLRRGSSLDRYPLER